MLGIEFKERHQRGEPDIWCPILICDVCGRKIDTVNDGMVQFWMTAGDVPIDHTMVTTHIGTCNHTWEKRNEKEGYLHGWWPLDWFLGYLVNNLEADWKQLYMNYGPPRKEKRAGRKQP